MGFNVILEDEDGTSLEQVDDPKGLLKAVLPSFEEDSFHQLRFIDPYGDTIFNRPQMDAFISEWKEIGTKARSTESKQLYDRIAELARRCKNEVHLYLRFRGE